MVYQTNPFFDALVFNEDTGLDDYALFPNEAVAIVGEEYKELVSATLDEDWVEIADAMIDIVFAAISCGYRIGLPMDKLWTEVVKSNMTKVGAPVVNGKLQKGENFVRPDFAQYVEL